MSEKYSRGGTSFDTAYLRRVGIYIAVTVLALAVTFLIGYHLWANVTKEIETIPAVPDTFAVTAKYDAWVFRDEEVLPSGVSGTVVPVAKNGERVGKTDHVASVYQNVPSEKLRELESLRSQIRLLESKRSSVISGDLGVGEVMASLSTSVKNGNLSSAREISSRLTALVAARATGGGDADAVITSLREKEQSLMASLGTPGSSVYTPHSGWYYSTSDGFETLFTVDSVSSLTPEKLDSLLAVSPTPEATAGKIVKSYTWYIAANMSRADGGAFYEGKTTEITLPGLSEPLKLTVESAVNGGDGRTAVVFSCSTIPEGVTIDRHLTVDFTLREVTGFGIPKDAVRVQDDQTGVFTFNGVMVKFKRVDIIEELDDMYIAAVHSDEEVQLPVVEGTGTETVTTEADSVGDGTGRKDYLWLEVNEFIVVKGKALRSGKVIG